MNELACHDLSVSIGAARLVDNVTLDVPKGEWLTVVGPNGAGKTTLLRAVAGLIGYRGTLQLGGRDARMLSRRERALHVALVPQVPVIPRGMTVSEYVLLGRTPHLRPLAVESRVDLEAAAEAIARLELQPFANRWVDTLSGGERQRVVVARMVAQHAPLVLLDEPTSALDVGHQQQVLDLVDELRRSDGLTVIATMHDLTLAGQYGDRVGLLVGGRLVACGTATDVLTEDVLSHHYRARVRVLEGEHGPIIVPVRAEVPSGQRSTA